MILSRVVSLNVHRAFKKNLIEITWYFSEYFVGYNFQSR